MLLYTISAYGMMIGLLKLPAGNTTQEQKDGLQTASNANQEVSP